MKKPIAMNGSSFTASGADADTAQNAAMDAAVYSQEVAQPGLLGGRYRALLGGYAFRAALNLFLCHVG